MLTAYLFDRSNGAVVEDWERAAAELSAGQVLWIDLQSASDPDVKAVGETFDIGGAFDHHREGREPGPQVHVHDECVHVTSIIAPTEGNDVDHRSVLDSLAGDNWVVTIHDAESRLVDDFADISTGAGQIGALDAPSFMATLLELVVDTYVEAFDEIEETLEGFDTEVLASKDAEMQPKVAILVAARSRVGRLRRTLAPHRRVYAILSHAELAQVSTEESAERFQHLSIQVDAAITAARDAKEAVVNSFDMLILLTENRTNEIVKVLTLASILLLPGALIAALLGMNVDLPANDFATSGLFWGSIAAMVVIAATTVAVARTKRWI